SFGPNFSISTTNGYYSLYTKTTLNDGWHLLAGVYDGSAISLYLDAALIASQPATGTLMASPASLKIGSSFNGAYAYTGDLNKAEIYNRALSQSELQNVYYASAYGGCDYKRLGSQCGK